MDKIMKTVEILGANRFETYTKSRDGSRAIIVQNGKILLTHELNSGWWLLPGGGIEEGETPEICVIREVEEETGFLVRPLRQFLVMHEYYEEYRYIGYFFACEVIGEGQMKLTDGEKHRGVQPEWIPLQEAIDLFSKHESYADVSEEKRGSYQREYIALQEYMELSHENSRRQIYGQFPGISCAYRDAAGRETLEYSGVADKEKCIPIERNTVFPACSISKFVTALTVMKLQEQALLDIDESVNRYLHQWKLLTVDGKESDATIRALLCHTAGIVDGEESFCGLRSGDPEISLTDILEGRTAYNNRPLRAEKPQGMAFEYSDAGYCVLQLMLQELMRRDFEDIVQELVFDPLRMENTFFASREKTARFENRMATGYDDSGLPIPGRFPPVPDLAASGLWSTPKELLTLANEFMTALYGGSSFLQKETAQEMTKPADRFPWTGLGLFLDGKDALVSRGWGENGQCIMKMNTRTKQIAIVMTNRNPGVDQAESGVEWLADRKLNEKG